MKSFRPVRTAVIGCGMISKRYLDNCVNRFNVLDVVGCSDLIPERSAQRAQEFGIRQMTNEEILSDPSIELVINLTYPTAHYEVTKAALQAGKHVHTEKMMATTFAQAKELYELARANGLYLTAAPDTFLGARLQTARQLLDSGLIGRPLAASVSLSRCYRHSEWKAEDEKRFAFCPGGGILNDVGCYYLTGLVSMLGSIERVCGFSQTYEPARPYLNPKNPSYGQPMTYEDCPNNYAGALQFENGVLCGLTVTSETYGGGSSFMLYGTQGTMWLDDPNEFGGALLVELKGSREKVAFPLTHAFETDFRGLGAADLAYALRNGRAPRCLPEMALHTFEAACGIVQSGEENRMYRMTTRCERPAPFEPGHTEYPEAVMDL